MIKRLCDVSNAKRDLKDYVTYLTKIALDLKTGVMYLTT